MAADVRVGQTVYPPLLGRRGISKRPWISQGHEGDYLVIRRKGGNETHRLSPGILVLTLISEDPYLG